MRFSLPDTDAQEASALVTLWRANDETPAENTSLWVPQTQIQPEAGQQSAEVTVGATPQGQKILCEISNGLRPVESRWLSPEGRNMKIQVPVPADTARVYVYLTTISDLIPARQMVTVLPVEEKDKLEIAVRSFRDHVSAGDQEKWEFVFSAGALPQHVEAFAVMSDKALNALQPFSWYWNPRSQLNFASPVSLSCHSAGSRWMSAVFTDYKFLRPAYFQAPDWRYTQSRYYGEELVSLTRTSRVVNEQAYFDAEGEYEDNAAPVMVGSAKSMKREAPRMMMKAAMADKSTEMPLEESAVETTAGDGGAPDADFADIELRAAEMPVAFFRSGLHSDSEGMVTVDFTVPNFNTTWQFQLLGYDSRLQTASVCLDAVASKKVMVQMNAPRFVRTGDRIVLSATAFNNSEGELSLGGRLEVVDIESGKILAGRTFKGQKTAPSGSRLLTLDFNVPSDCYSLAVRAYALSGDNSDGEQIPLAVLPSSSPVVESTPFYLAPKQSSFEIKLPKMDRNAQVTLLYCDNPVWYCVTALPDLVDEPGKSLTSLLRSLYGNSIGLGIMSKYPAVREGLEEIISQDKAGETDILDSPLGKNAQLKTVSPDATPWVNSAHAETERMHSLGALLDSESGARTVADLMDKIVALQNTDGGMAWFDGGQSSQWMTGQTLLHFGMLDRFGYMPSDQRLPSLLKKASQYCQKQLVKEWKEMRRNTAGMLSTMTNYLYIRSLFSDKELLSAEDSEFSRLAKESMQLIETGWKGMSVYDKATAAVLLYDRNYKSVAQEILRSLSEYSTVSEQKGMWFDTLGGDAFSPWNKLITTAQVLEAYSRITPDAPEVDLLRQWLLLQRQGEDWGTLSHGAELVQAILGSGSGWTESGAAPEVRINGRNVLDEGDFPKYGEAVVSLPVSKVSGGKLQIVRSGAGPAWGGVLEQYVAPISDIRAAATEDVSVEKQIFLLDESGTGVSGKSLAGAGAPKLRLGDLVRVQLTVVLNRDMEYVALTDERGACLEPVEALSGPMTMDNRFGYREVRNTQSNFFFYYLPKGKYQLSYDCRISQEGDFAAGIATLQSQYAPSLTGHSAGQLLKVSR